MSSDKKEPGIQIKTLFDANPLLDNERKQRLYDSLRGSGVNINSDRTPDGRTMFETVDQARQRYEAPRIDNLSARLDTLEQRLQYITTLIEGMNSQLFDEEPVQERPCTFVAEIELDPSSTEQSGSFRIGKRRITWG